MGEEIQENSGAENAEAAASVANEQLESQNEQQKEKQDQTVPLSALQSERAQRQQLQDELKIIKDHLSLVQANQAQQAPKKEQDEFGDLSDDDVVTVKELKQALARKEKQVNITLQEVKMTQKHPDYQEIVTKYLPEVIKNNPAIAESLRKTQDYDLAYYLAKSSDAYKKEHKRAKKSADAERIVQNANRAGSLSSVGGTSPINEAKRYKEMSDADFTREMNKNLLG